MDEVQSVTSDAAEPMSGTFRLSFNFSGDVQTTEPIAHDAPASIAAETAETSGESMQAKLQQLSNVGTVAVSRSPYGSFGGYVWLVTFLSEPGNLQQMTADTAGLAEATASANPTQGASVVVRTIRDGNANVYYNYKTQSLGAISGRLTPCWVMLLNEDVNASTVTYARSKSVFSRRLSEEQHETLLTLDAPISARYVRVQLEPNLAQQLGQQVSEYLSIAEVEVFQGRSKTVLSYKGGSPIASGTYQPEQSLRQNFAGMHSRGPWILSILDLEPRKIVTNYDGSTSHDAHGRGAFDDWVLVLTVRNASHPQGAAKKKIMYHMDIFTVVETLPSYGKLFVTTKSMPHRGGRCYVKPWSSARSATAIAAGSSKLAAKLNTSQSGSIADRNVFLKDRFIIYVPNRGYLGLDRFSYRTLSGVTKSATTGVVVLDTRVCGQANCLNEALATV